MEKIIINPDSEFKKVEKMVIGVLRNYGKDVKFEIVTFNMDVCNYRRCIIIKGVGPPSSLFHKIRKEIMDQISKEEEKRGTKGWLLPWTVFFQLCSFENLKGRKKMFNIKRRKDE